MVIGPLVIAKEQGEPVRIALAAIPVKRETIIAFIAGSRFRLDAPA